ncbi:enoyl-CoA hydratase/isomerase family protein [Streptomyces sp. NBC_01477]|uniref:enoyl-CoA hydratase/isomerase family protein n=1 Tax=Streptomyces sp. NBC_01477 TaxID=2976015 RepID=UPI002E35DD17|nr:enoyl-CoA hydratase/isomerase family protein [Streptomyces sp. NBC_01477]
MPAIPDDWQARNGRYVPTPRFEDYAEKYADHFVMTRRDGIIELRMHTRGGPAVYGMGMHNAWGQAWQEVGSDPDNEVVVLTGTGDAWLAPGDPSRLGELMREPRPDNFAYRTYLDAMKLLENLAFAIDVPTIAAVNGPGAGHTEFALLCDITLCSQDAVFADTHLAAGVAPGDGMHLALQELLGTKRAAYHLYTGAPIDATAALDLGLVNEVLPTEELLPRAWQLAEAIRSRPKAARRLTHAIVARPWKRRLVQDFGFGLAHEMFGISADQVFG